MFNTISDGEIEKQIYNYADIQSSVSFSLLNKAIHMFVQNSVKYQYLSKNRLLIQHDHRAYMSFLFTLDSFDLILKQIKNNFIKKETVMMEYYSFLQKCRPSLGNYLKKLNFFINWLYSPNYSFGRNVMLVLVFKIATFSDSFSAFRINFEKYITHKKSSQNNPNPTNKSIFDDLSRRDGDIFEKESVLLIGSEIIEQYFEYLSEEDKIRILAATAPINIEDFSKILLQLNGLLRKMSATSESMCLFRFIIKNLNYRCNDLVMLDAMCDVVSNICGDRIIMGVLSVYFISNSTWIRDKGIVISAKESLSIFDVPLEDRLVLANFIIKKFAIHPTSIIKIFSESLPFTNTEYSVLDISISRCSIDIFFILYWLDHRPECLELVKMDRTLIRKMLEYVIILNKKSPGDYYQRLGGNSLFYYVGRLCKFYRIKLGLEEDQIEIIRTLSIFDLGDVKRNFLKYVQNIDDIVIKKIIIYDDSYFLWYQRVKPYVRFHVKRNTNISFDTFCMLLLSDAPFDSLLQAMDVTIDATSHINLCRGYIATNNIQLIEYYDKRFCVSYSNEFLLIYTIFERDVKGELNDSFLSHMIKKLCTEKLVVALLWSIFIKDGYQIFSVLIKTAKLQSKLDNKLKEIVKLKNIFLFYDDFIQKRKLRFFDFQTSYVSAGRWRVLNKIIKDVYENTTLRDIVYELIGQDIVDHPNDFKWVIQKEQINYFMKLKTIDLL